MGIHGVEGAVRGTVGMVPTLPCAERGGCDGGHDAPLIFFSLVMLPREYSFPDQLQ